MSPTPEFHAACEHAGIALETAELERIERFLELLVEANRTTNLTRITDPGEAWMRHVFDALTLLPFVLAVADGRGEADGPIRLLDVGSGGGLPAVVLAIALPGVRVTMLEATGRKAEFLRETNRTLGLRNTEVVNDRAETAGCDRERWRERFDVVTARAVGRLPVLLELTVPFARVGGLVLAVKGEQASVEVEESRQALHRLHAHVIDTVRTPTGTIVVIEKQRTTPKLYPRRPGEPKRAPIRG